MSKRSGKPTTREEAARDLVGVLDTKLLKALAEPIRVMVLRHLILKGPSDIGTLAAKMPQDRSVISRHLRALHDAGLLRLSKEGRRVVYELDGSALLGRLEAILDRARSMVAICCPQE